MNVRSLARGLAVTCEVSAGAILLVVSLINLGQVLGRYVIGFSVPWAEEVMRYTMMWLMMLGGVACIYRVEHMAIESLVESAPERRRDLVRSTLFGIAGIFCIFLVYYGWTAAIRNSSQYAAASGMPMIIPYLAIPVGGALMLIEIVLCWFAGYDPIRPEDEEGW
jgi:TRAP-type C4-dicarboxylate transport system permease small subunit